MPTVVDSQILRSHQANLLTSHLVDLNYVAFSKAVWDGLSPEQQAIVQQAAEDAAEAGRQAQLKLEEDLVAFLEDQGLEVYEPDLKAFREHVQAQYVGSEFAESWPEGVLDAINALGDN
ncbi:MAG: hypothetical protein R2865_12280 [Deinococcales bacterium]